jgi:outer membrane lipoprotein-sorting protein
MKQLLFAIMAFALTGAQLSYAQDTKAKNILEAAQKKMNSLKTLKASFTLKLIGKNGKVQDTKKGSFLMKGEQYHITIPGQEIISDGKTVWTYMKDANEVQVSNNNPSDQSISPTKLFTGSYDKDYSYRYLTARKAAGKACDVIELKPNKAGQFDRIELAIDKTGAIAAGNIFEKNGSQYQYEVNAYTANPAIPASQFTFDTKTHPKVEVVDLR